jgi:hypothetical protein
MSDDDIIDGLIEREVGAEAFAELHAGRRASAIHSDPADRGGITNMGITRAGLSEKLGRPATDADVAALTLGSARDFYRWILGNCGIDSASGLAPEVASLVLDIVVNHGRPNGVRILQRALGATVDGIFGSATRAALYRAEPGRLFRELGAARLEFTGRVISGNLHDDDHDGIPDNTEFASGWLNRQASFWRVTP